MLDFLDTLAMGAKKTVEEGYYRVGLKNPSRSMSLAGSILACKKAPIIAEIKLASPSFGMIKRNLDASRVSKQIERGGAVGISVLTEPKHFEGSLEILAEARSQVKIPILTKDIVLTLNQIDAAYDAGADAILFITALFDRGYCEKNLAEMINYAHSKGLEVLLEAHTEKEFKCAVSSGADIVGINNRDLRTLKVDLDTTKRILKTVHVEDKIVVSESGIKSAEDIRFLRECGADAFLVGSSVMTASSIEEAVKRLVDAI